MVPSTAAGGPLLGRKEVVDLNDRWLLGNHHLALGACPHLGDLLFELGGGEVRDDDQAAGEGWDKQDLAGPEEIILKTSHPVPRQVAVGGGDQADGGGHHHHHHHDPLPQDPRAELQVERHLEVADERHNGYQGGKEKPSDGLEKFENGECCLETLDVLQVQKYCNQLDQVQDDSDLQEGSTVEVEDVEKSVLIFTFLCEKYLINREEEYCQTREKTAKYQDYKSLSDFQSKNFLHSFR